MKYVDYPMPNEKIIKILSEAYKKQKNIKQILKNKIIKYKLVNQGEFDFVFKPFNFKKELLYEKGLLKEYFKTKLIIKDANINCLENNDYKKIIECINLSDLYLEKFKKYGANVRQVKENNKKHINYFLNYVDKFKFGNLKINSKNIKILINDYLKNEIEIIGTILNLLKNNEKDKEKLINICVERLIFLNKFLK